MNFVCANCQATYPASAYTLKCAACSGPLNLCQRAPFRADAIVERDKSLWRYEAMLPVGGAATIVSMGEGMTPLVSADFAGARAWFKLEYMAPTGSFKDRGSTVLVTKLREWGIRHAADDSSGNAGASFAAYCARAGISAEVYTPASASPAKLAQIEIFCARLHRIEG